MTVEAFAPAKINLTLHVTGRRGDGYHYLDSLVVFAALGDRVQAEPADRLTLELAGPEADPLPLGDDNLVLRAARHLHPTRGAALRFVKNLPVASGMGGGSSDAAAALRALSALWDCPLPPAEATVALGADVPVCMAAAPMRMTGIGEVLSAVTLPPGVLWAVLANPRIGVSTPAVFAALGRRDNPSMPAVFPAWSGMRAFLAWLGEQRNDLEAPVVAMCPPVGAALTALHSHGAALARMSGSGATVFGLFETEAASRAAAQALAREQPGWWVHAAPLGGPFTRYS
ncbi:MAG: 4-(cytidine 5'-diphospho)-2-C-methyl-D-erythritol kinase [Paracoccaceae bacterium]